MIYIIYTYTQYIHNLYTYIYILYTYNLPRKRDNLLAYIDTRVSGGSFLQQIHWTAPFRCVELTMWLWTSMDHYLASRNQRWRAGKSPNYE